MLGKLFGSKKNSSDSHHATAAQALSGAISSAIISAVGVRSIPTMPAAAQKAFQLATDPKADAQDFIEVIESDEALSARVIKIANSVFFDRGTPSQTIADSVTKIGINELRCLLNATSLSEIFPSKSPLRAQLWSNDVATALIARTLAARILPSKAEIAFLGGLMHDIGKLLLLQRLEPDYVKVTAAVEGQGVSFSKAEYDVYVFDHTEVGQLVGEKWRFGPEVLTMIRHHHDEWDHFKGSDPMKLAGIVRAADIFAHALGLGHSRSCAKLKRWAEDQLDDAFAFTQVSSDERKSTLAAYKKSFDLEFDLYAGKD